MFQHLIIGILMTFIGLLPPGMMNMTVVRHALTTGMGDAMKFSAGAAAVVGIQSLIALTFAEWLIANPEVIVILRKVAILVFALLAIYFYRLSRHAPSIRTRTSGKHLVLAGAMMSSLNMLAIPFFLGYSTLMNLNGWLEFSFPNIYFFVAGAIIGSFMLFIAYAKFSTTINARIGFLARNINLILAVLFILLALMSVWSVFISN